MARSLLAALAPLALALTASAEQAADAPALDAAGWAGIRAAHETWKRGVVATDHGHAALHPAQRWHSSFDGRGVTIAPEDGAWTWGLALERWGFDGALREIEGRAAGCAEGERVEYPWDAALTEWYVNGASGLEHGYTVHRRPEGHHRPAGEGALVFELAVRGDLAPEIDASPRSARFVDGSGASVLSYSGLTVYDASGRELAAALTAREGTLSIEVDERGARYPLTIDPVVQLTYVKASNTGAQDQFGAAVAISGNTVVIGAPFEDSNATGIGGNGADNSALDAGAAYVFVRSGMTWSQQAYLKASNTAAGDEFGLSVAISGDTVVVGAWREDSNATSINGDQTNNAAAESGAAYVFVRSGLVWSQQAYLKASNTETTDWFGYSVSISLDTIAVGAPAESSNASGINGDPSNNLAPGAGAAYVFTRSAGVWSQQAYVKASNPDDNDGLGWAVSLSFDTLLAGAFQEASNAVGVGGNQADNSMPGSGAAYVFIRIAGVWSQQAYLKASNTAVLDRFGWSVSVSDNTAVVGATQEDSAATGVGGDGSNNAATSAGAAYVFQRSLGIWSPQAYLKASNTGANDEFGTAVAIAGSTIVVGAPNEDSNATGIDGDQANNAATDSGAAYVFVRSFGVWSQRAYLKSSNSEAFDGFGTAVAVAFPSDVALVGAFGEDSNASGVNGNQANNGAITSGAAYLFFVPPTDPLPYCFGDGSGADCPCSPAPVPHGDADKGCPNNIFPGGAKLVATGLPSIATDTLLLTATNLINAGGCLVFQGTSMGGSGIGVFGDGLRCASGTVARMRTHIVAGNMYKYPDPAFGDNAISIRGAVASPGTRYYQGWYRSANPTFCTSGTFNLTNGVRVIWSG